MSTNTVKRIAAPTETKFDFVCKKRRIMPTMTDSCPAMAQSFATKYSSEESLEFLFDDDDFENLIIADKEEDTVGNLDLRDFKRCRVSEKSRDKKTFDLVLVVASEEKASLNESAVCYLQGPWRQTKVESGDIVSISAVWDEQLKAYKINAEHGICVTNPDTLISGTAVVGSLFCRRKGVLQSRFSGIDANSKVMVIGSMVHELWQTVLAKCLKSYAEISAASDELLNSRDTAFTLYASKMTHKETVDHIRTFLPNIVSFVNQYIEGNEPPVLRKEVFKGTIAEIEDIEENLLIPKLGLKGKIDLSVRVRRRNNSTKFQNAPSSIPLELKTGTATFSLEHKGQLTLYQMMLTAAGKDTRSGLLLYLRDGIMKEIQGSHNEQRDLIVLRNDLGYYITKKSEVPEGAQSLSKEKFRQPFELPDPVSHHSACSTCPYSTICCSFGRTDPELQSSDSHPWQKVLEQCTAHLCHKDYEYFIQWCGLLSLEEQEGRKSNNMRSLWTDSPEIRQSNGRAIINLKLFKKVNPLESRFLHVFQLDDDHKEDLDLTQFEITLGEYVTISTTKRLAIASGTVYDITPTTISVNVERNLLNKYANETFIVDKHESQSGNIFNFTNLGILLSNSERSNDLRSIVVSREIPSFTKHLPTIVSTEGAKILKTLNTVQIKAVLKALTTESYMLIKGLPGTGKTQTLVAIVRLLHMLGKSVIITSHTHSAVDNLLFRLKSYRLPLLRLGSGTRINSQLQEFSESALTADCRTEADLARVYNSFNIVGVTCLGSAHSIFLHRRFDMCIVDEATQVFQATVLRPLFFAKKFILVGDPDQLPPLIRSNEARKRGAEESLFHRLDSEKATSVLTLQYRMNKTITKLANELTYAGSLKCANNDVQMAAMKAENVKSLKSMSAPEKWLQRALQTHIEQAVIFLDTKDCSERNNKFASIHHSKSSSVAEQTIAAGTDVFKGPSKEHQKRIFKYANYCEAAVILHIIKSLLTSGYNPDRIGLIAPYRAQVEILRKLTSQYHAFYQSKGELLNFSFVEVNTVDQYQGRDKDIVIYSCAKTGAASSGKSERFKDIQILEDKRRLTVAITRSKHKLIIVGDAACLQKYTPFRDLLGKIPSQCKLPLEDGRHGFNWQYLLDSMNEVVIRE